MATWVGYPASYTKGRNRPIQYVVIHSTEGSEGPASAEAGAAYDKIRADGTSTHLFVDSDTAVREVPDGDRAHHARFHGNEIGIGVELCGRAGQTAAQWHDAASLPMLRLAAVEVAAMCREHGLPVRRLSVAEVRAAYYAPESQRPKGICGHVDVTNAYPEDGGSHTDPGPAFPWAEFLGWVDDAMEGDMADVYYEIQSTDTAWNGKVFVSNRIHRRGPIRGAGGVRNNAIAGATRILLTDADRKAEGWESFLDSVAGPLFPAIPTGGLPEHVHPLASETGPAGG